jgi:hypothetical protein
MKKIVSLHLLLACHLLTFAQVGIGTTSPNSKSLLELNSNSKGLLLPRLTATERTSMNLSSGDAGMLVYQTSPTKGSFMFDGTAWCGLLGSTTTGATLRWDDAAKAWVGVTNLFNQGTSIGIGTTNPKTQLHINSNTNAATTRIQITNPTTGYLGSDGLVMGVNYGTGEAHLIQQENKAFSISTNATERMRIDSTGNIGINTSNPAAKLDINGSVKIGHYGTPLTCIMRSAVMIDLPLINGGVSQIVEIACPNVVETATVHISPGQSMADIMISYARVSSPGNVEIKFTNLSLVPIDEGEIMFYMTIIQ